MAITLSEKQQKQIDVESLAKYVFRRIKEDGSNPPFVTFLDLKKQFFPGARENESSDEHIKLLGAIALLERRGLVMKGFSYQSAWTDSGSRPTDVRVYLTSIGVKSDFDDEILLLVDKPEAIVGALEQKIGTLDDVVRQYYLESIRANQEGLYISSVICLGAASERAIHWLAEAIASNSEKYREKIEKRRYEISRLIEYLSNSVIPHLFEDSDELKDRLDRLARIYRENRNEAGHPKTVDQSWSTEDQRTLLSQFRKYITTICKAIDECRTNSKPTTTTN